MGYLSHIAICDRVIITNAAFFKVFHRSLIHTLAKLIFCNSVVMCVIILIAFAWVSLIKERYTGFLVAFVDKDNINPVISFPSLFDTYLGEADILQFLNLHNRN